MLLVSLTGDLEYDRDFGRHRDFARRGSFAQASRALAPEALTRRMLATGAVDRIMLDEFSLEEMRRAVALVAGSVSLEASGGMDLARLRAVADTGVDCISIGALTKHVRAIDLSLRIEAIA